MSARYAILTCIISLACVTASADKDEESIRPLSVAPLNEFKYPSDRPKWIEGSPELDGQVHRWPVCSAPSVTVANAHSDMLDQARAAVKAYVKEVMPDEAGVITAEFDMPESWFNENLIDESKHYVGKVNMADGEWYEEAVELGFMPEFREQILKHFRESVVTERMQRITGLGFIAFVSLATISTVLRVSTRRKSL